MCGTTVSIRRPTSWTCWSTACAPKWIQTRRSCTRSGESDMSLDLLRRLHGNFSVRLNLWYALVFTASSAMLCALVYYLLAAALEGKDREVLEARLKEYSAVYQAGGVSALQRWVYREGIPPSERSLFVRLVNVWNNVTLAKAPDDWVTFRDTENGLEGYRQHVGGIRIPKDA